VHHPVVLKFMLQKQLHDRIKPECKIVFLKRNKKELETEMIFPFSF